MFPTQANFLKQYPYADFFAIFQKKRPICIYKMNLMCFADHLNSLLLILSFFSFILSLFHFASTQNHV